MRKTVLVMVLSLVVLGCGAVGMSAVVTIQGPDDVIDSQLYGYYSSSQGKEILVDTNYGGDTLMKSYRGTGKNNPIFQFDLSGLGIPSAQITKVEIMLYIDHYDGSYNRHFYLKKMDNEWVESEVTAVHRKTNIEWNNQSAYPWGDVGSTTYGDIVLGSTHGTGWATYSSDDNSDLLQLVKDMIDGTENNYGFTVQSTGTTGPYFRTSEYTDDPSTQPKMVITYVPEPATIGLIGLGVIGFIRKR